VKQTCKASGGETRRESEKLCGRNKVSLGCSREWTPLVDVAKGSKTPWKVLDIERYRAGASWRTLKGKRSLREDETTTKVVADGAIRNTARAFGNKES